MVQFPPIEAVLAAYPANCRPKTLASLGNAGGFSGAGLWRIEAPLGPLCLRRWPPEHPDRDRLTLIHAVLRHVQRAGFVLVPLPLTTSDGQSWVEAAGHFWELTPWLPGRADYCRDPSREKLSAAFSTLARFHLAAADFDSAGPATGPAPAVGRRLARVHELRARLAGQLEKATLACEDAPLAARASLLLAGFWRHAPHLESSLASAQDAVSLQPCIRDIHDRHVLFERGRVTGLVDFGSLQIDSVATDVARLLGTTAGDDAEARSAALAAYESVRPLTSAERELVPLLDRCNVVLSGLQWLEWLLVEERRVDDRKVVFSRLDAITSRLGRVEMRNRQIVRQVADKFDIP